MRDLSQASSHPACTTPCDTWLFLPRLGFGSLMSPCHAHRLVSLHILPSCHGSLTHSPITLPSGLCRRLLILWSQLSLLQEVRPDPQAGLARLVLLL